MRNPFPFCSGADALGPTCTSCEVERVAEDISSIRNLRRFGSMLGAREGLRQVVGGEMDRGRVAIVKSLSLLLRSGRSGANLYKL